MADLRYLFICGLTCLASFPAIADICFLPDKSSNCSNGDYNISACTAPSGCKKCDLPKDGASPCTSSDSNCTDKFYNKEDCCDGGVVCEIGKHCQIGRECESGGKEYCPSRNDCICDVEHFRFSNENCSDLRGEKCTDPDGTVWSSECGGDDPSSSLKCECGYTDSTHEKCQEFTYKYKTSELPYYIQLVNSITNTVDGLGSFVCADYACCAAGYWDPQQYLQTSTAEAYCRKLNYTATSCSGQSIACPFDISLKKCLNFNS